MKKYINKPTILRGARRWMMPFLMFLATLSVANRLSAQSNASLEFASNGASTSATGPTVASQLVTFERNTNNPTGNTFITQTPTRTVTFSLTNQQRTMASAPNVGLYFGGAAATNITAPAAYAIYPQLAAFGSANATHFRSWAGTGTSGSEGMSTTSNYGVEIMASTRPMYESNAPLPTAGSPVSYQMADLVLTFNSPVSNPIIHFSGLGGAVGLSTTTPISAEFVLLSSGLSLTRLSGSSEFSVPNSTEIRNSATKFAGTTGAGGASGSVRVNGTNITSISFRVYLTAQYISTGNVWALGPDAYPGDGFLVSVSLNACNSGATPSVQNISNTCPATTVDLNSAHTATAPAGSSLVWYTTSTRDAGTQVTGAGITAAGAGTYYAFYYDSANNCYSAASNAVTVTINSCPTCTSSGNNFVNLNSLYTGTHPDANTVIEWWTTPTRVAGTKVADPTHVTVSGTYYAFFYDTVNNCWNTNNSTSAVTVNILPSCACYEDPTLAPGETYPVKHGITLLGRAGSVNTDWPKMRNSAYTALESKTKGFVITRNSNPEATITIPVVGMVVFDTDENAGAGCLKIYTGAGAGEGWKCFNTQGCAAPTN